MTNTLIENEVGYHSESDENSENEVKSIINSSLLKKVQKTEKDRLVKRVVTDDGKLKSFNEIQISTKTVIAITNLKIDLENFFRYLPITDHTPEEKRRGRKKRFTISAPVYNLPYGSVIFAQKKREFRGSFIKDKTKKSEKYFLHSVTIVLALENNKKINVKVSSNGKLQITGCKQESHYINTVAILLEIMKTIEVMTNEKVYELQGNKVTAIFNTVMQNMDFNIGFHICRDKLDNFINRSTDFRSVYEISVSTSGVNIKVPSKESNDQELLAIDYNVENYDITKRQVPYQTYCDLLEEKEKRKESKKEKERLHTFLVFASGSIIMSSRGSDMDPVYQQLVETLIENRERFMDFTVDSSVQFHNTLTQSYKKSHSTVSLNA
jgi:TATA-box binding protein (TBP) (component of TFIID and TFIIIB)